MITGKAPFLAICVVLCTLCTQSGIASEIHDLIRERKTRHAVSLLKVFPELAAERDATDASPLHLAAAYRNMTVARLLLARGADANATMGNGFTPLHCAVISGSRDMVELLAESGADVDAATADGSTPLHMAVKRDAFGITRALIAAGANPDIRASNGLTPKEMATDKRRIARALAKTPRTSRLSLSKALRPDRRWRVSVGVAPREASISLSSTIGYSPSVNVAGALNPNYAQRARIGPVNANADRQYDDGYVRKDPGTDLWNTTWYWGYNSSRQVKGNTLVYTAYDGTYAEPAGGSISVPASTDEGLQDSPGIFVQLGMVLADFANIRCGLLAAMGQNDSYGTSRSSTHEWTAYERTVTDAYDLTPFTVPPVFGPAPAFPSAPYSGDYTGPGPVLDNQPMWRRTTETEISWIRTDISESFDMGLTSISYGGFVECNLWLLYASFAAGWTETLVSLDARRSEVLYAPAGDGTTGVLESWSDTSVSDEWYTGRFTQADVGFELFERLRVGAFYREDVFDDISGTLGPTTYEATLSSSTYGGVITWKM